MAVNYLIVKSNHKHIFELFCINYIFKYSRYPIYTDFQIPVNPSFLFTNHTLLHIVSIDELGTEKDYPLVKLNNNCVVPSVPSYVDFPAHNNILPMNAWVTP